MFAPILQRDAGIVWAPLTTKDRRKPTNVAKKNRIGLAMKIGIAKFSFSLFFLTSACVDSMKRMSAMPIVNVH